MWQNLNPAAGYSSFFEMCDTIEGARDVTVNDVYVNATNTTTSNGSTATGTRTNIPPLYDNSTSPEVPSSGIGLEKALANFGAWYKNEELPGGKNGFRHRGCCLVLTPPACADLGYPEWADPLSVGCYNSHNASSPTFTDWSVEGRWDRQWVWMLCNEPFAFWQKLVNHSVLTGPTENVQRSTPIPPWSHVPRRFDRLLSAPM